MSQVFKFFLSLTMIVLCHANREHFVRSMQIVCHKGTACIAANVDEISRAVHHCRRLTLLSDEILVYHWHTPRMLLSLSSIVLQLGHLRIHRRIRRLQLGQLPLFIRIYRCANVNSSNRRYRYRWTAVIPSTA